MQYVGKSETACNLMLNNHRKDSMKKDTILGCTKVASYIWKRMKIHSYWANNEEIKY